MNVEVVWENKMFYGCEHLHLSSYKDIIIVDSTVIGNLEKMPYSLTYQIQLNSKWEFLKLNLKVHNTNEDFELKLDGKGSWFDKSNQLIHELNGALDIDISSTPFTNTLPINRFSWELNQSRDFSITYISIPDLSLKKVKQSYTLIREDSKQRVFKYKSSNFESLIYVDYNGLVVNYPGVFKRVFLNIEE